MRVSRVWLAVAVTAAALGGVLVAASAVPADAATTHTISIRAAHNFRITAPHATRPGWTRARDTGAHSFEIWRSRHGAGKASFVADLNRHSRARLYRQFAQAGEFDPGHDGYVQLTRGTYYVNDANHPGKRYTRAQVTSFRVTGRTWNAKLPSYDTVRIAKNVDLGIVGSLSRTRHYLRIVNHSGHIVNVGAVRVGAHVSASAIDQFLAHPDVMTVQRVSPDRWWGIAQFAGPHRTEILPQFLSRGRWIVFSQALLDTSLQKTHRGQARLITIR